MRFHVIGVAAACMVSALLLSSCSQSTPKETTFNLKVELKHASPACDQDPHCWLPTQAKPKLVSGESVSLYNKWPERGDSVHVICQTTGQHIKDYTDRASNKWYGILVPTNEFNSTTTDALSIKGGRLAYVSAVWLADTNKTAPAC